MHLWPRSLWRNGKVWLCALALCSALGLTACSGNGEDKIAASGNATLPANDAPALPGDNATPPAENAPVPAAIDQDSSSLPATAEPTAEGDQGLSPGTLHFAKFSIEVKAAPEAENYKVVTVSHSGKAVTADSDIYRSVETDAATRDFPLPGCESMTLELFTGGANCCFGYYILTSCPEEDVAAFHEPTDGGMGKATAIDAEIKGYPMADPAFMYYSPANQSGAAILSLNRVESPRPTRYVVFDANTWREDKIGEFAQAYKDLAVQSEGSDGSADPVASAISRAYYTHMAGADAAEVKALLATELPAEFADLKDTIFSDIVKATAEFKPFTPVPLQ